MHGVQLSLGGAERPDPGRVACLAGLAERLAAELAAITAMVANPSQQRSRMQKVEPGGLAG